MQPNVERLSDAGPVGACLLQDVPIAAAALPISPSCRQHRAGVARQVVVGKSSVGLRGRKISNSLLHLTSIPQSHHQPWSVTVSHACYLVILYAVVTIVLIISS